MSTILGHFINGVEVADDNRPTPVYNPATGELTRHVAMASKATVEEAIAAASAAYPAWRDTMYWWLNPVPENIPLAESPKRSLPQNCLN